jgi:signal transduction histidine kinase/ActR/RegA family two-component response regulator
MRAAAILTVALIEEADIVAARQRARQIAGLLGFEAQDQTRIATAVSEIARNAATYGGGGRIEFSLDNGPAPALLIRIRDHGPGIADVDAIMTGRFKSASGMGVGIAGTQRLMDRFEISSKPGVGTTVLLGKRLPRASAPVPPAILAKIGATLASTGAADPLAEARTQNQELLRSLAELRAKQEEADRLNAELEETNRGVVALYAELDQKAAELTTLNAELADRVAAAVADCQHANDTLRQSQKMEAVGQLTGGIAHDFNNLLQIVTGNLEMLSRQLPVDAVKLRRATDNAMSGAQRAATLTQRLLAFARRQPLAPKPLRTNHLVEGMSDLMRRTLGETVSIDAKLAADLWLIEADANQLENALLNLAVNARDAMEQGGTLTISTANGVVGEADTDDDTLPGHYVSLSVCDTGSGMTEATMARVFEPFFTTKEVGRGTGLGLSMVYGFVKQSGGHLRIESSLGRGTTVTMYLPKFSGAIAPDAVPAPRQAAKAHSGEAILVVEDDAGVRLQSCEALGELGYAVLTAAHAAAAIELIDSDARIDLVFTDVVLPGELTGRDIAEHCGRIRPDTPIVFTTGYARDAIGDKRLDPGVNLLAKPYSFVDLAVKMRAVLDDHRKIDT